MLVTLGTYRVKRVSEMKDFVLNRSGFEGLGGTPLPGTTCYSGFDGFVRVENTSSANRNLDQSYFISEKFT